MLRTQKKILLSLLGIAVIFKLAIGQASHGGNTDVLASSTVATAKGAHWTIGLWYNTSNAPNNYHMPGMYKDLDVMKASGITWVRFIMHKGTGTGLYDQLLLYMNQKQMHWLATVANPNCILNGAYVPCDGNPTARKTAGNATQRAAYKAWLASMVNRYKTQNLKYYEIWNEPNYSKFWNIDPTTTDNAAYANAVKDYLTHLEDGYTTIKANDPTAVVILGGLSGWQSERWLDELVRQTTASNKVYFDIIGYHPYSDTGATGVMERVTMLKGKLAKHPLLANKPIWITELGFNNVASEYPGNTGGSETKKAEYLTQTWQKLKDNGITGPIVWYNFNGDNAGSATSGKGFELVTTDRTKVLYTYNPSYQAYKTLWATPTGATTPTPTTPAPTITSQPGSTRLALTLSLHGLGNAGDNVLPNNGGNKNPRHTQREVIVRLFNQQNVALPEKQGTVTYDAGGMFKGNILLDNVPAGTYTGIVDIVQFLPRRLPGIVQITIGQTIQTQPLAIVTGDANNDNKLSAINSANDLGIINDCRTSPLTPNPRNCADAAKKQMADINDDGTVNDIDANIFLRELSVQGEPVDPN